MISPLDEKGLLPCPFCGGPARTFQYNGTAQASCAALHTECAGTDVVAPVAMWNRRALSAVALPDELEVVACVNPMTLERLAGRQRHTTATLQPKITEDASVALVRADQAHSTIASLREKLDELEAAVDAEEKSHGMPWRFWAQKAQDMADKFVAAEAEVKRLTEEKEAQRDLAERLKLEAQGHASEAKTANSTIYEIYQVLSGGKGEPGNWHGAEPAREYVGAAEARIKALEEMLGGIIRADDENTGAEPSVSVLARAIDDARQYLSGSKE